MTSISRITTLHNTAVVVGTAEAWQALALALLAAQRKPKAPAKGRAVWPPPVYRITFGNGYTFRMSIWQGMRETHDETWARAHRIAQAIRNSRPALAGYSYQAELVKTGGALAEDLENLPSLAAA